MLLGTPACTGDSWVRSASTDPLLCARIPDARLQPRVVHGRARFAGGGKLVVREGMHRYGTFVRTALCIRDSRFGLTRSDCPRLPLFRCMWNLGWQSFSLLTSQQRRSPLR